MNSRPTLPATSFSRRDALRLFALGGAALAVGPAFAFAAERKVPSLAGPQPSFYRFRVGDIEAVALNDGDIAGTFKEMAWWAGASEQQLATTLQSAFLPPNIIRMSVTVLLLRAGDELVLIDSGCGPLFGAIGGRLVKSLAAVDVKPEQITALVLSHAHGDHFGGLLDANNAPVFPNARLIINRREFEFWSQTTPDLSAVHMPDDAKRAAVANAQRYLSALKDRWHFVAPGDKPIAGLEIVDAPGHTPGHVATLIGSHDERLLHVADAAHHHAISFEHPEWAFAADVQPEVAQRTRRALLERATRERLRIFGAHLPFPALGHVRAAEQHFEYVIEPWAPV